MSPNRGPFADVGPFEHLEVAIRVAERGERPAADDLVDADGLSSLVIDKIDFRQPHEHGRVAAELVFDLRAASDHLLRRNAVDALDPRAHELDAAASAARG